jgi:4-amino-4-deoxy-L-arabinose transferase-like glycosyltransferase
VTRSHAVLVVSALVFLVLSLDHLSVFPAVGEDEPWIAAAPHKLATQGVYGSDLFTGYYGVDRHNYQHPPLYPLIQAGVFKILGAGVFQMRLLPVLFGLALIFVVFLVGARVGDHRVGAVAVFLLLVLRVYPGGDSTGILLLDRARINRYDIAVPVFALLAFSAFIRARCTQRLSWHFVSGLLTGLASLSHLFGAFWLPLFLLATLAGRPQNVRRTQAALVMLCGFALPWLPWLAYIASGWSDFLGQFRFVSSRFDLFTPSFYLSNALHGRGPISIDWFQDVIGGLPWTRPGTWTVIGGVPMAVAAMAWAAWRSPDRHRWAGMLAVCSLAMLAMFLTLLHVKTINYMIGLWPLAVLVLAWLAIWLWDSRTTAVRAGLLALLALILFEGTARVAHASMAARHAAPYDGYTSQIARCIPEGSRVLGLQHYWLGLRRYDYRTWLVPANYTFPPYYHEELSMDDALEKVDPDVILIDPIMRRYFESASQSDHPSHHRQQGFESFMMRRHARLVCTIQNRTYGTMRVYRLAKAEGPPTANGELFLRSPDGRRMFSTNVATSAAPVMGTPEERFQGNYYIARTDSLRTQYDLTADGQRFLMRAPTPVADGTTGRARIIVMQHWLGDLKRLLP